VTIHHGLTFDEYSAIDAVNWSTLRELEKSPLHYRHLITTPREDTDAMRFGRAVHTSVLEPDRFALEYAVWDGGRRGTNAYKEFEAVNASRTVLSESEYARCIDVRDAVRRCPEAAALLCGESEVSMTWTDPATGIECKARIDHVNEGCIVDLKTTPSLDPHDFERSVGDYRYDGQISFYHRAMPLPRSPRVIAVESKAPHDVAVFRVPEHLMQSGEHFVADLMFRLSECRERDEWRGRYSGEQELSLPAYLLDDDTGLGITIGGDSA
jgi:hypothetical protein